MRRGYTAQAIRDAEAPHLAAGEPLMQRAAEALAREITRRLEARRAGGTGRVVLLVGSGSNGGDALFAGALVARAGVDVVAVGAGSRMHEGGRDAASTAGVRFASPDPAAAADVALRADVIVDGLLGTGTSTGAPALRGAAREVVAGIRNRLAPGTLSPVVVAVDLPSGVDPDSGAVADEVVLPADVTVTFGGIKAGLLRGRGAELAGEVLLAEIGIEGELAREEPAIEVP